MARPAGGKRVGASEDDRDDLGIPAETADLAVDLALERLPEEYDLALLSAHGARVYGWGSERTTIGLRGFYVAPDWFSTARLRHEEGDDRFQMKLTEVEDMVEPAADYHSWELCRNTATPLYVHDEFDYERFRDQFTWECLDHDYPHIIRQDVQRFESTGTSRAALKAYSNVLQALYYLREDEVLLDVVTVADALDAEVETLHTVRERFLSPGQRSQIEDDELAETVLDELETLFDRIGEEMADRERDDSYGPNWDWRSDESVSS